MWQRRAAQAAYNAFANAARSAAKPSGQASGAGAKAFKNSMKQAASSIGKGVRTASPQSSAFMAWRQETQRFAAGGLSHAPSFASSPVFAQPAPMAQASASTVQTRSASSGAVAADGEEESGTSNAGSSHKALLGDDEGDGPGTRRKPRLRDPGGNPGGRTLGQGRGGRGGQGGPRGARGGPTRAEDEVLELTSVAKESFLKKPLAIPVEVREVMYKHRWDKLLVDTRRSVALKPLEGKVETYTAMVAVGNMKGMLGLGVGDAPTAQEAVAAAYLDAFNNLAVIPLYRGHTIYHHIEHKYHHMKLVLCPRPHGWGIRASDLVTELCNLAGVRDISVKVMSRRRQRFFVAAAVLEALQKQNVPHAGVEGSGVYVREVFSRRLPMGLQRDAMGNVVKADAAAAVASGVRKIGSPAAVAA